MTKDQDNSSLLNQAVFLKALLAWHRDHARDFPWRRTREPYPILAAEFMLQQTSAAGVVAVFEDFLRRYPTPDAAANADDATFSELLRPIGLAHRARTFKRALQAVVDRHGGVIPSDVTVLMELPGVGPYTARAVACHAFGQDVAAVDVNVLRVMGRVFGLAATTTRPHRDRSLWRRIDAVVPSGRGRSFNLALLDLAAQVCVK